MPAYLEFTFLVLALAALIWCLRYVYTSFKAIKHYERELQDMAIAEHAKKEKYKFDIFVHDESLALNEAEFPKKTSRY